MMTYIGNHSSLNALQEDRLTTRVKEKSLAGEAVFHHVSAVFINHQQPPA